METSTAKRRDVAYQLHPFTNLGRHESEGPLVITRGKGVYVYDESGREYIEGLAGLWCTALGFGEERLVEAAARQMRQLPYYHQFGGKANNVAIDLAERLIKLLPGPMSKVFFNNSGSEANETAIKLVWYYNNALGRPRKKKILSRLNAYHGTTLGAASLTGLAVSHRDFDLPIPQVRHADCPDFYRYGKPGESEEAFATRLAESLDQQILREDPDTVAAFIAEPVMGAGGVIVPPRHVLRAGPGRAAQARRAPDRRRGHLRLRAHGPDVRLRDLRSAPGHHDDGQGHDLGLPAPLGHRHLRGDLPRARPAEREARHVRARLHVHGSSRLVRGGPGGARHLRGARPPRARAARGPAAPRRAAQPSPTTRSWATCAGSGSWPPSSWWRTSPGGARSIPRDRRARSRWPAPRPTGSSSATCGTSSPSAHPSSSRRASSTRCSGGSGRRSMRRRRPSAGGDLALRPPGPDPGAGGASAEAAGREQRRRPSRASGRRVRADRGRGRWRGGSAVRVSTT